MKSISIADELDVIFLTFDEPKREEFWVRIRNMIPWAKRVDGVRGSDAAHKAAAAASSTERFILIDGDNIPDENFFNQTLVFPDENWEQAVYRWRARNHINGLMYGNGGISSWTRKFVNDMRTHEASDGSHETAVEFCFDPMYWAMHDCYSTTYPNGSAFQAWRAGFREGVKMCLDRGRRPTLAEFRDRASQRNLDHLKVWHSVGADVENGHWAIYGARLGTWLTMLQDWDYTQVQDFAALDDIWVKYNQQIGITDLHTPKFNDAKLYQTITNDLKTVLGLDIVDLAPEQSRFFKHHYRGTWRNRGIMVREMDCR